MPSLLRAARAVILSGSLAAVAAATALTIPDLPLAATATAKPLVMLVASKDHKLFYEAYNDAIDVDGDGAIDVRFKPLATYAGLFDPTVCYTHNNEATNSGLFTPSAIAANGKCTSSWSGNWLNYATTSRIDALRVALYGGYREVDTTTSTILRRAYIPQDAHSWAKEYTSEAVDGYRISDYTPLSQPSTGKRHFFGNLTANATTNCATLSACSGLPPLLATVLDSSLRVWEWASKERPVLDSTHGRTRTDRTVRVQVCTAAHKKGCKLYPNGSYKPIGLLHDYGETDLALFGLLTGSYDKNLSGGVLRKVVSSFKGEVATDTGIFTASSVIVRTFNNLRIRDFNNGVTSQAYKGGWVTTHAMSEGTFPDWGNPMAEMVYEGLRYFAGAAGPTSAFTSEGTIDTQVGLSAAPWDDPYASSSLAAAPWCAKANILAISDPNPSYDSDQLPGTAFADVTGMTGLSGFNAQTEALAITQGEVEVPGSRFIGQSGAVKDSAPSAKTVSSLGTIRGLAPEEPTKEGSYYAASAAYYGRRNDLRSEISGTQSVDFFSVVLTSPLPKIVAKLPNGKTVSMVPFAKSIAGSSIVATKGNFQPTNQIVDFYVDAIANSGPADANTDINGGRYYAKFRINFEDVEQGADHDMDAIAEYEVIANADSTLTVKVKPLYQAGSIRQNMGYVISGTTADGVHLVVQDENVAGAYYLNVPAGETPGACDSATAPASCALLPYIGGTGAYELSNATFTTGSSTASLLKDPLWYAAKWGGFIDKNGNGKPDLAAEWDADGDGNPDTYAQVQNPVRLKEQLRRSFEDIVERSASAGSIAANSTSLSSTTYVYQSVFNTARWSGHLYAYQFSKEGSATTPEWDAATMVPPPEARKMFVRSAGATKSLLWGALTEDERPVFGDEKTVNYLRGVRTDERQNGGSLRDRTTHVLGDIVHSSPHYVKDTGTIYVGANDGMLHAISAKDGAELFTFSPAEVVPRMKALASVAYSHQYYVDGEIVVSSQTQTPNKNLLFATLGRGGKGLFALDVTTPASFDATKFLWEYTASGSIPAGTTDTHLGYMLGKPQLAKMNTGGYALIAGNGYNSTSGEAALFIFLLDAAGGIDQVKKILTGVAEDNGLATPGLIDTNGDGRIDTIYAGDLKGNVWKFDVSGTSSATWGLALSSQPLYKAKNNAGHSQPITTAITSAMNAVTGDPNVGKRFIYFGTGSYITAADSTSTGTQTWYGIIDSNETVADRTSLKQRYVQATGTFNGKKVRTFSTATANDMSGKKGWLIDLALVADAGERIVSPSNYYRRLEPVLQSSSIIPSAADPCIAGGRGYLNAVNPFTGAALTYGLFDANRNDNFADDLLEGAFIGSLDLGVGTPTEASLVGDRLVVGGSRGGRPGALNQGLADVRLNGGGVKKGRVSWREILTD